MMIKLIFILLFIPFLSIGQTKSIVTELYLNNNFTEKGGITPGTDNIQAMDCDQITTRYYVDISGISTTGKRTPSQDQLTASGIACNSPQTISNTTSTYPEVYTINVGTSTGTVTIDFKPSAVPDKVYISWNGSTQHVSPYIGSIYYDYLFDYRSSLTFYLNGLADPTNPPSGTYPNTTLYPDDGYPRVTGNVYQYVTSFNKSTSASTVTITVYPSKSSSGYEFTVSCPHNKANITSTVLANAATTTGFSSGGTISTDGGSSITERGVCYGTSANPTISGTKTSNGTGTGSFTSTITGLTTNTVYYYRSFATNANGTAYGTEYIFRTPVQYTASTTWTCPAGVLKVNAEAWGGGGAGAGRTTAGTGGGGAGGQYAKKFVSVVPSTSYTVTIAATRTGTTGNALDGNDTWFGSTGSLLAKGGKSGTDIAAGIGSTTSGVGDVVYAGGSGAPPNGTTSSGGGGGGAGSTGTGNNASTTTGGAAKSLNGGKGGNGRTTDGAGAAGAVYGAGGGGAWRSTTNRAGGNGAAGLIRINYP
jgi:hypothetical protein